MRQLRFLVTSSRWLVTVLPAVAATPHAALNDRPIIGILTQPLGAEADSVASAPVPQVPGFENATYIAASYVKFVESAGARAVPVHFDAPEAELRSMFRQLNGLLLPGGGTAVKGNGPFRRAGELLFNLAINATDNGDPFPIHGTCLGFEMLGVMAAKDDSVLCTACFDSCGLPLPLSFTVVADSSSLFKDLPPKLRFALAEQAITENSHTAGLKPTAFQENSALGKFFEVLSTNVDRQGKPFVSTMEAKRYPFSATQWHPEKNNFEWGSVGPLGKRAIPHSAEAVAVSQYVANKFVGRARMNFHRFVSAHAEEAALIYNFRAVADPGGYFTQIYMWENGYTGLEQPASAPSRDVAVMV